VKPTGVSVERCRLRIKKRIAHIVNEVAMGEAAHQPAPTASSMGLWVRGVDDIFTFSIDLGEGFLFRRGLREWVGEAPIRENLAAACLQILEGKAQELVATAKWSLVDPAAGAGTLLLEAVISGLPWPPERPTKLVEPQVDARRTGPELRTNGIWDRCVGFEGAERAVRALEHNVNLLERLDPSLRSRILLNPMDSELSLGPCALFSNLPYGDRIKIRGAQGGARGRRLKYVEMISEWRSRFRPSIIGVIVPREDAVELSRVATLGMPSVQLDFGNGGRPVSLLVWTNQNWV
jgi:23S rRNA G2445 N2-methylase RlmL